MMFASIIIHDDKHINYYTRDYWGVDPLANYHDHYKYVYIIMYIIHVVLIGGFINMNVLVALL